MRGVANNIDGKLLVADQDILALLSVDIASGNRTIISSGTIDGGPQWQLPEVVAVVNHLVPEPSSKTFSFAILGWERTFYQAR